MSLPVLKRNSKGAAVSQLQALLVVALGDNAIMSDGDGFFGPRTDFAVRAFQTKSGLVSDGIVGVKTWGALGLGDAVPPTQLDATDEYNVPVATESDGVFGVPVWVIASVGGAAVLGVVLWASTRGRGRTSYAGRRRRRRK